MFEQLPTIHTPLFLVKDDYHACAFAAQYVGQPDFNQFTTQQFLERENFNPDSTRLASDAAMMRVLSDISRPLGDLSSAINPKYTSIDVYSDVYENSRYLLENARDVIGMIASHYQDRTSLGNAHEFADDMHTQLKKLCSLLEEHSLGIDTHEKIPHVVSDIRQKSDQFFERIVHGTQRYGYEEDNLGQLVSNYKQLPEFDVGLPYQSLANIQARIMEFITDAELSVDSIREIIEEASFHDHVLKRISDAVVIAASYEVAAPLRALQQGEALEDEGIVALKTAADFLDVCLNMLGRNQFYEQNNPADLRQVTMLLRHIVHLDGEIASIPEDQRDTAKSQTTISQLNRCARLVHGKTQPFYHLSDHPDREARNEYIRKICSARVEAA